MNKNKNKLMMFLSVVSIPLFIYFVIKFDANRDKTTYIFSMLFMILFFFSVVYGVFARIATYYFEYRLKNTTGNHREKVKEVFDLYKLIGIWVDLQK